MPIQDYSPELLLRLYRQMLLVRRAELVDESKQTIENLKEEVRDVGDEAERATRETENSLELRTRDRYRKLIGKIDSTLNILDLRLCIDDLQKPVEPDHTLLKRFCKIHQFVYRI